MARSNIEQRSYLHKDQLSEFLTWCRHKGMTIGEPQSEWHAAKIKPVGSRNWYVIHRSLKSDYLTIPMYLLATIRHFLREVNNVPVKVHYNPNTQEYSRVEFLPPPIPSKQLQLDLDEDDDDK